MVHYRTSTPSKVLSFYHLRMCVGMLRSLITSAFVPTTSRGIWTSPMSVTEMLFPSQDSPTGFPEPDSARVTSASHLPRLWQLFLLARSWTRMIPWTVWKKTCLVFRWLWLPPTSHNSTKKDFCCWVPSWNSCSFTSIEQPTVQDGLGSAVS